MLIRITKAKAKKLFNEGKVIRLCPNRMRPEGPFSQAALISNKEWVEKAETYRNNPELWKGDINETAWCLMYNNWQYYNITGDEAGWCARYYIEEQS